MDLLPNAEILNILLTQSKLNFRYKRNILAFVIENKLRLYERTLSQIEKDISTMKYTLLCQVKHYFCFITSQFLPIVFDSKRW